MKSAAKRVARNAALRAINFLPMARHRMEMNLSGLSRGAAARIS